MRSLALALVCSIVSAEVTRVDVSERSALLDTGYERIVGRAYFDLDPKAEANRIIPDLELAPHNANGQVEFSADIYILKPTGQAKNSKVALFEVANRGNKGLLRFNGAARSLDPRTPAELGDGFLFERGYTLVWVGWQFDLLEREHAVRLHAPVAKGVTGWTRSHFTPLRPANKFSVAGGGHQAYPAIDPADPKAKLIVRDYQDGPGHEIPRNQWRFTDPEHLTLDGGFEPGKTYDVIYRAANPGLAGLGAAAIRDFISHLKQEGEIDHAIAYGSSQSGRFLRTFIYEGFNADEHGERVFDGVWPHIAGAAMGSFTHRFAQPTRTEPYYTVEVFPFRDAPDKDPHSGRRDSILSRAEAASVTPKIIYTLTSSEYWNRSASLMHTTIDGKADAPLPGAVRIYYYAGTQHGAGRVPPPHSETLEHAANSNDYMPLNRALLVALESWVTEDKQPPPSQYPSVDQLAKLAHLRYPKIPGLDPLGHQRRALPLDFGPEFHKQGIIAFQPPRTIGPAYPAKLPQLDQDGNELGGIRLPSHAVPLATYGGWNRLKPSVAKADYNPGNTGSTIPFPRTKHERLANKDPRRSIEERYPSRKAYRKKATDAARALIEQGYLLERDVARTVEHSLALWDHLAP